MTATSQFTPAAAGACALALCLALPAGAQTQQPVGVVDAMIDGTAYHGETLDIASEGTSTAEFRAFGPMISLTIQAHDPDAESIMRNVLVIDISLMGDTATAPVMEASVSYWPEGMNAPFYISDESGVAAEVTFDALSLDDDATATGSFSAVMCRQDGFFEEVDLNDCRPVEGTFDTALRRGE